MQIREQMLSISDKLDTEAKLRKYLEETNGHLLELVILLNFILISYFQEKKCII